MKKGLKLAVLLIFLTETPDSGATNLDCSTVLTSTLSSKLNSLPGLKTTMVKFVTDPLIPNRLKTLIRKALEGDEIQVELLTQKLRDQFFLAPEHNALSGKEVTKFRIVPRSELRSLNQKVSDQVGDQSVIKSNYFVALQDRVINHDHNDLLILIHELAHIRFSKFFEQNIASIAKRLDSNLISLAEDGIYEIDELFWSYLDERYAVENEFLALRETYGRFYNDFPASWSVNTLTMPEAQVRAQLSDYVCFSYEIIDPQICSLRNRKIFEILIGSTEGGL